VVYAQQVAGQLGAAGLRVEVDARSDRMTAKIRDAQLQKIPYMLGVGDKEQAAGAVAVRLRNNENLGPMALAAFLQRAQAAIAGQSAEPVERWSR
jgi:threonyl-tRNA synthetase